MRKTMSFFIVTKKLQRKIKYLFEYFKIFYLSKQNICLIETQQTSYSTMVISHFILSIFFYFSSSREFFFVFQIGRVGEGGWGAFEGEMVAYSNHLFPFFSIFQLGRVSKVSLGTSINHIPTYLFFFS
jgi:hypothetical protein